MQRSGDYNDSTTQSFVLTARGEIKGDGGCLEIRVSDHPIQLRWRPIRVSDHPIQLPERASELPERASQAMSIAPQEMSIGPQGR